MPLPEPSTLSPGKLVLVYTCTGVQHLAGVRYLAGVELPTAAQALTDATAFATAFKAVLPADSSVITGYRITDPQGASIIEGTFAANIAGTHASGSQPGLSKTVSLTGKGTATVPGEASGQTRVVAYVNNAFTFGYAQKNVSVSSDTGLNALKTHLTDSTRYWADFFGQKATVRGLAPIQYNSRAQRKYGV